MDAMNIIFTVLILILLWKVFLIWASYNNLSLGWTSYQINSSSLSKLYSKQTSKSQQTTESTQPPSHQTTTPSHQTTTPSHQTTTPSHQLTMPSNVKCINLYNFLPPPKSQGGVDACQSYAMIYHIGNYYKMMNDLNLNVTNTNFQNVYNNNKGKIKNYYNNKENILHPLILFSAKHNCRDSGTNISEIMTYVLTEGLVSYKEFTLNFNFPAVSKSTISGCSQQTFSTYNKYKPFGPSRFAEVFLKKKGKFNPGCHNQIKRYLNEGIPLLYFMNATKNFHNFYNKKNKLTFPQISEGVIYTEDNRSVNTSLKQGGTGHIITIIGYVENVNQAYKLDGSSDVYIVMNSWGTNFGDNGCFYMTSKMLDSPFTVSVTAVSPNPTYTLYQRFLSVKSKQY